MKRKTNDLVFAFLLNLGLLAIFLLFFHPAEKTDDYLMKTILQGAFGYGKDGHLLYINYYLGLGLKALQNV